jgi:CAAX prenyl protease-like protein
MSDSESNLQDSTANDSGPASIDSKLNPYESTGVPNQADEQSGFIAAAFTLPLIVFLVIANFYPDFADFALEDPDNQFDGLTKRYVWMIGGQVIVAAGLLCYFHKSYLRHFPLKISPISILVGVVGIVLWVGLCELHIERTIYQSIGLSSLTSTRPAFNPFESLTDPSQRNIFLALRFTLLVVLVPIVEELFLRGWLVRWIHDPNWEAISLKNLSWAALMTPCLYGVLTHPAEAIAAFVWFGLVTLLMYRTGNLWDCVVAHAVTNLLLGLYVIQFEAWHLW